MHSRFHELCVDIDLAHVVDDDGDLEAIAVREDVATRRSYAACIPVYIVKQHWHARYRHHPENRWRRGACAALFTETRTSNN
jgi:hypothetical protein